MTLSKRILAFLFPVLLLACEKEGSDAVETKCSFDLAAPAVEEEGGEVHRLQWKTGEKLSLIAFKSPSAAGLRSSDNVVNFSSSRFSSASSGETSTFSGNIPALPAGVQSLYAIYPASNLTVSSVSVKDGQTFHYELSGPTLQERQDGTGWKYCYFTACDGKVNTDSRKVEKAPSLTLANTLVKFGVLSGKPITKVTISKQEKTSPGLSGAITLRTSSPTIREGCPGNVITLIKSGEGTLPTDLLFACGSIPKGNTLELTFTAQDGSEVSRAFAVTAACLPGKLYSLGTIDLSEWTNSELASQTARNMGMGINLGGLDSVTAAEESLPDRADASGMHILDRSRPETYETNGSKNRITSETIAALKAAGFSSVRIPVTWFNHIGAPLSNDGEIDRVWLEHIKGVVDLALDAGMYAVVNVHHDTGSADHAWLRASWSRYAQISERFKSIWTQIAAFFQDYDHHLLFEGYNEIADDGGHWFVPGSTDGFKAANALNQDFVNAVRALGGNNAVRNLIVSTYTASDYADAIAGFEMPEDLNPGHLLVQIHSYRPIPFVTARTVGDNSRLEFYESEKPEIDDMFARVKAGILDKGWPCVLGEYGAFSKKDQAGNRNELGRAEHAYYYTTRALQLGIVPMYWYNPMDYRDRDKGRWTFPVMAQGLIDAWKDYCNNQVVYKKYDHDAVYPITIN